MPDDATRDGSLPLDLKQRIDRICDRFEAEWKSAKRPQIEFYISRSGGRPRTELLGELLAIELEYRGQLGEQPSAREYDLRFPGDITVIREAFDKISTRSKSVKDTVDWSTFDARITAHRAPAPDGAQQGTVDRKAAPKAPAASRAASKAFGRFQILRLLGRGAFGSVYQAHDPQLDRYVALKIPHAGAVGSEDDAQRFLREARAAGQLRHPNIVPVFDAGRVGDTYYIASAYIEGTSLRHAIRAGRFGDRREAVELLMRLAATLDYAHERGIVHRDVKPENILIDATDNPYVLDFGLARRSDAQVLATMDGVVLGTPVYMSPEQAGGKSNAADGRSDLWSLGVILYELLCDSRPFAGEGHELYTAILEQEPIAPRKKNGAIPRDLETITLKCLAKTPALRYQTCADLAEDLRRWRDDEPIAAQRSGVAERFYRSCRRNPALAVLSASAALLVLIAATVGLVGYSSTLQALAKAEEQRQRTEAQQQQAQQALAALEAEARQRIQAEQAMKEEAEQRIQAQQLRDQEAGLRKRAEAERQQAEAERQQAEEKRKRAAAELDANKAELANNRQELLKAAQARDAGIVAPVNAQPPNEMPIPPPPDAHSIRMQLLAKLRADLAHHKSTATAIKPRLDEAEVKLNALVLELGAANLRVQTLNGTLTGTADDEAARQAALAAARVQLANAQYRAAAAREVFDDLSGEIEIPLNKLEKLRVLWFNSMDLFGRLSPKDHERSIALFDQWLQETNDDQATHLARCVAYWRTGQPEKALADLRPLVDAKGAGLPEYLAIRGILLCEASNERDGVATLGQAIKLNKQCWLAYVFRAQANLLRERYENALSDLRFARQIATNQPDPLRLTALIQATCRKPASRNGEKAVANARRACELTENGDWQCLESLAAAYAETGEFDEAVRTINAAAVICDEFHRVRCNVWKKQFESRQPIRLSPCECIGIVEHAR